MSATDATVERRGNGGNMESISSSKKDFQSRKWVFTWNNYNEENYATILLWVKSKKCKYIIGKEIGENKGTKHLQGFIEFKGAVRRSTITKKFPKIFLEKGNGSCEQNFNYCSKSGDYVTNIKCKQTRHMKLLNKYNNIKWKPWQQKVIDICESKTDDRTINWFWENKGAVGKSFLAKFLVLKYKAIIADGKKDNVFNQINITLEKNEDIKIVLLDVPRYNSEYINYGCLEQIKNGMLYSGKYEGGICLFENPHVIIFANHRPDTSKLSIDRWNIINIDN